jgi:hypothetical protein
VLLSRQRGPAMALLARAAGRQDRPGEGSKGPPTGRTYRRFLSPQAALSTVQGTPRCAGIRWGRASLPSVSSPAEASTQAAPQPVGRYVAALGDGRQQVADSRTRDPRS